MKPIPVLATLAYLTVATAAWSGNTRMLHVNSARPEAVETVRTFITADLGGEAEIESFRRQLIEAGARNVNWFGDNVIVCDLPRDRDFSALLSLPSVSSRPASLVPDYTPGRTDILSQVKYAYGVADRLGKTPRISPGIDFEERVNVITPEQAHRIQERIRSHPALAAVSSEAAERLINQNSEILSGSIKFYLILPESNGQIDASTENWYLPDGSESEDLVMARSHAVAAILDWQGQFASMGITTRMVWRVPECRYEPIHHSMDDDEVWIRDTMINLDPSLATAGDVRTMVHLWNQKNRGGYDWIFTLFVGHSRNVPTHRFLSGYAEYVAYAYLGGPYLVVPYPAGTDRNQIGEGLVYSQVVQHEAGHIFWALDEYPGAPGNCNDRSGYLNYTNMNVNMTDPGGGIARCIDEVDCIMNQAVWENIGRPFCQWSQGQMGVIDGDNNRVPDVFDAPPVIEFAEPGNDTVNTPDVTIRVTVRSQAIPNRNPAFAPEDRIDYASPLREAHANDGADWQPLMAADGKWDGIVEETSYRINGLQPGVTTVQFQARNEVGVRSEPYVKLVYFVGVNYASVTVSPRAGQNVVAWDVIGEDFGAEYSVYRLSAGDPDPDLWALRPGDDPPGLLVASDVKPSGQGRVGRVPYAVIDDQVTPGEQYRYWVKASGTVGFEGDTHEFITPSNIVTLTAMVPIPVGRVVSHVSPNPFHSDVSVSINIPPTYQSVAETGGASIERRVETPVDVTVYDVLGRRIRTLHSGGSFYDVVTLKWDGNTASGRPASSGVYFIRVKAGPAFAVEKVLLVR